MNAIKNFLEYMRKFLPISVTIGNYICHSLGHF
nr:MAG TPA: Flavin adenine dinucleotide (FAD)-dependent sulfhydryl oxidase [Caudoviricetes sp.]DAN95751.1 MAG TPA: Flavin adenine dinucleotide (FAD)-dependent sulfhydryl oxidase [Caudoviricetes sp.]